MQTSPHISTLPKEKDRQSLLRPSVQCWEDAQGLGTVYETGPCVTASQFYLHRSGSRLHHHFKGKTLMKVDALGFMDYLQLSI